MENGLAKTTVARSSTRSMKTEALEAYGVQADVLAVWREAIGPELLPVQTRAVRECGLLTSKENLIVFSPTSSGKTFIGEMGALQAMGENTKVIYLVPQRALADEKYREFRARYERLGFRIVVSSGDRRQHDELITGGDFDLAVVVFEKLQALLVRQPDLVNKVGLVVVDELQLITDLKRGPSLELLLTKLRIASSKPRILGLSAVLGRADTLARWLGARLLIDEWRPVELRKGVLCRGEFHYSEHNSGADGVETFADVRDVSIADLLVAATEELALRGEQVLLFASSKRNTVEHARELAKRLPFSAAEEAIAELGAEDETQAQGDLRELLAHAVAFHSSDLSVEEREIVERHFRSGAIRVLVSTSTLAVGMNLPTKNVVIDSRRWRYDEVQHRSQVKDMGRSEYENMSGRAGRYAFPNDFGRSVLVTRAPAHVEALMGSHVRAEFEQIVPTLKDSPLEDHVLNLVASGLAGTQAELESLLLESFTGFVEWSQAMTKKEFASELSHAIQVCKDGRLLRDVRGIISVTEIGRACASKVIDVKTGICLAQWATRARRQPVFPLEILTKIGATHAGKRIKISMTRNDKRKGAYRERLLKRLPLEQAVDRELFERIADPDMAIDWDDALAVKKALLLLDWIGEGSVRTIERQYGIANGGIRGLGAEYAWLVEGLGAIAAASGWSTERVQIFDVLAERLVCGVLPDALPIARLHVRSLRRSHMRLLVLAGFKTDEALRAADVGTLGNVIGSGVALESLTKQLGLPLMAAPLAKTDRSEAAASAAVTLPARPEILAVDLPGKSVSFRGHAVPTAPPNNLQPQALLALACLAANAGKLIRMHELATLMQRAGGLRRRPTAPEAKRLQHRIRGVFKKHLPKELHAEIHGLIQVVRGEGMRLTLPAEDVKVIWGNAATAAA